MSPSVTNVVEFTAEENESHYKRDYEFNKGVSKRSPVSGWEDKYIREGNYSGTPPKEVALVKGQPHKFKHVRTGNIYNSRSAMKRIKSK